ncbi:Hha toxicity modulator TomB [Martelella alba]|uniref:Hha toxicity modulator TomB n=1 Tax=Martelella alba TaxID=2590451 RepID=A0ABY2SQP1_9HYPH|nr:Hha toxicity modulator TomB [Martelella alba]TKI06264.1 Hha toxicity modulator TomB [Martelella alba]
MDEYSPKRHDIAQLKYLCATLYDEGIASLGNSYHGWVNDPASCINLQMNELIDHIASYMVSFKLKYHNESELTEQVESFLDDTFTLFSSYGINALDIRRWRASRSRLFGTFSETELCIS